jgi:hypothetical protein
LVGGGATAHEIVVGLFFTAGVGVGVVVGHLMVVPRNDPGGHGVGGLEGGVGAVERVAGAVIVEGENLAAVVAAHLAVARGAFVDVVAKVDDEIEVFAGDMFEGGEETGLVVLAGDEGEAEAVG